MLQPQLTLNCRGKLLYLEQPVIMGILNVTPDSFYDGGQYTHTNQAIARAAQMIENGATIIDIGGMSSRPGAEIIDVDTELKRVIPVIEALNQQLPAAILSIDTIHSKVAKTAIEAGAHIINDISAGGFDEAMYETVAACQVPYILMHMKGTPQTMQKDTHYRDVLQEVMDFFIKQVGRLRTLGVKDIIIDPGFGFGKSIAHNYDILKNLHLFQILELPILAGLSRKSMIYKYLNTSPDDALNGTTALNVIALQQGAKILRVHDVKAAKEVLKLMAVIK